jgi:hypothetical protein
VNDENKKMCPECGDARPIELDEARFPCVLCLTTWQADDRSENAFEQLLAEAEEEQP